MRKNKFKFVKMHAAGNDFVIIDSREIFFDIKNHDISELSNRNKGIGFDQLVVITKSENKNCYANLNFWNADGSISNTCGNATRCVAHILFSESKNNYLKVSTPKRVYECKKINTKNISVNMGHPLTKWFEIPLAKECSTLHLPIKMNPVATNFGNPHCTFFVENLERFNIKKIGKKIETHKLFPEKTNVQIAQIINNKKIKMKVWERGTGVTLASGSSSCATSVAANRRNLVGKKVNIILDGGEMFTEWKNSGLWLTGDYNYVFSGETFINEK